VAVQPDPYFALPSLYGAPAYTRPPRPAGPVQRPLDPDDLPLATLQTEEERRLADALLASRSVARVGAPVQHELPGGGQPDYLAPGSGAHDAAPAPRPRLLSALGLADHFRTRG
jgi:hypothetical protein